MRGRYRFFCSSIRPPQHRIIHQRVLHVHDYAGGSVGAREFFHRQDRLEKLAARAAVLLRNLDPHQSKLKKLIDQPVIEDCLFVHLFGQRTDFVLGKLTDIVAKKNLVFGKTWSAERDWQAARQFPA